MTSRMFKAALFATTLALGSFSVQAFACDGHKKAEASEAAQTAQTTGTEKSSCSCGGEKGCGCTAGESKECTCEKSCGGKKS